MDFYILTIVGLAATASVLMLACIFDYCRQADTRGNS